MKKALISLLAILTLTGCYSGEESKNTPDINETGNAKAIEDPSDLWQFFENSKAGFSLQYPHDVTLGENLIIEIASISELGERPLGYSTENATAIRDSLAKGRLGKSELDFPLKDSKEVREIAEDVYGQEFLVLSRFDICSTIFERKLIFYPNDYQVVITLSAPAKEIIAENSEYFTTNPDNCGDMQIWNFDKQDAFYEALSKEAGSDAAQNWFDTFDAIIDTIELRTPETETETINNLELLQGLWKSLDDSEASVEFSGQRRTNFYSEEQISQDYFEINDDILIFNAGEDTTQYSIVAISKEYLTLIHLPGGNMLKYEKQ